MDEMMRMDILEPLADAQKALVDALELAGQPEEGPAMLDALARALRGVRIAARNAGEGEES